MALDFDGVDDFLNAGDRTSLEVTTTYTMSLWINPNTPLATSGLLMTKNDFPGPNGYWLYYLGAGEMTLANANGSVINTTMMDITEFIWQHIVVTSDGTNARFYKDGVLRETIPFGPPAANDGDFLVGASATTPVELYDGLLDDMRLYNVVLTDAEISSIHASRAHDGIVRGLVVRYLLDEGPEGGLSTGTGFVKDASNEDNDATPSNSPTYTVSQLSSRRKLA